MGDTTEMIDLSQSPPARPPVQKRRIRSPTPAVDLTSDSEDAAAAGVGFQQHTHHGGACCSSAPSQPLPETAGPSDAEQASDLAPAGPSANKGKRKRALPDPEEAKQKAEKAKQRKEAAQQKKLQAKAEKDAKTAAEKHRTNADGRVVRWAPSANQKTKERIARAMPNSGHRLYLLDRKMTVPMTHENGPQETFTVLGATANVYTVTVARHPCCTCPDFQKGNLCKHYLFVMLRVLRLPRRDPLVWQKALLKPEAEQVLGGARSSRADAEVLADNSVLAHFRQMTGSDVASSSSAAGPGGAATKQRPIEGECAICYDSLEAGSGGADNAVTFCQECGNNVHVECFKRWTASKKSSGEPVTCVYCRHPWLDTAATAAKEKEYVNLRDVSQAHQEADTSLETLYGDTAVWIHANNGRMGRRQAANLYRLNTAL